MSACGRLCCKSLFALLIANFSSCRRGFRVNMGGTSSPGDKRIGDFGNEPDATSISDRGLFRLLAGRHIAAPNECDGTSAVGESRHRIPGASVGQPTEPCLAEGSVELPG